MSRRISGAKAGALVTSVTIVTLAFARAGQAQERENGAYESTFELIEQAIFETKGCTNSLCHGSAMQDGLDLRPTDSATPARCAAA